jgi:hypothetical protein
LGRAGAQARLKLSKAKHFSGICRDAVGEGRCNSRTADPACNLRDSHASFMHVARFDPCGGTTLM